MSLFVEAVVRATELGPFPERALQVWRLTQPWAAGGKRGLRYTPATAEVLLRVMLQFRDEVF